MVVNKGEGCDTTSDGEGTESESGRNAIGLSYQVELPQANTA